MAVSNTYTSRAHCAICSRCRCVQVNANARTYMSLQTYMCLHKQTGVFPHIVGASTHGCFCKPTFGPAHMRTCSCTNDHKRTPGPGENMQMPPRAHASTCTQTCQCTCEYTCLWPRNVTHIHTHTHTDIHTSLHTYMGLQRHTCVSTHIHACLCTHIHALALTNTHAILCITGEHESARRGAHT